MVLNIDTMVKEQIGFRIDDDDQTALEEFCIENKMTKAEAMRTIFRAGIRKKDEEKMSGPQESGMFDGDSPLHNNPDEGIMISRVFDALDEFEDIAAKDGIDKITPALIEQWVTKIVYLSGIPRKQVIDTIHRGSTVRRRAHIGRRIEPFLLDMGVEPFEETKDGPIDNRPRMPEAAYVEATTGDVTVPKLAKAYLMELGYKGAYPDSTLGKNMLAEVLNRAYNECNCPVDVTLATVYNEASTYLKACTEFMAALAKTLDEFKDYKVG